MGLFSTKKTIVVSSTVYNMAGDEADRPNFLKSSLFSAVMNPYDAYLGEVIVGNYLTGPGIKQRSFFNYSVRNDIAGLPTFSASNETDVDPAIVAPFITVPVSPAGLETQVQLASIANGDFTVFAEQYILATYPLLVGTAWVSEYLEATHEIVIQYEGGGTDTIPAGDYDKDKRFLNVNYYFSIPEVIQPLVPGTKVIGVTDAGLLPDVTGFTLDSTVNTGIVTYDMFPEVTEEKVYSNGDPTIVTVTYPTISVDYNGTLKTYTRTTYLGGNGTSSETTRQEETIYIWEYRQIYADTTVEVVVNDLGGGDTETVTTTTDGDHLRPIYDHQTDTQDTILEKIEGGPQIWIYEMGSGEAVLDALQADLTVTATPEFMPFLPIRLNNKSILHADYDDDTGNGLFTETKKAYRRAAGNQSFTKLVEEVEDNPDLSEIDYAYVQWGVGLNTQENSAKRYIYEFLSSLIPYQNTSGSYMSTIAAAIAGYEAAVAAFDAWVVAQSIPGDPLYNTPRPSIPSVGSPKSTTIKLKSDDVRLTNFDTRISWVSINETLHAGVAVDGALNPLAKGDLYLEKDGSLSINGAVGFNSDSWGSNTFTKNSQIDKINIYYQTDTNNYKKLEVWGLLYENYIYGGKAVRVTSHEALDDYDSEGFLLPLHMPTVKAMSLVHSTQMGTSNTFIVFNSYEIFKKKWYETFLGQLFIIIALVVISALINPAAIGGISGVFGTNAALGATFGLTGTGAVVAGAVTNALAAIVISQAISVISVEIFGAKWGAIISSIVGFIVTVGISAGGLGNLSLSTFFTPQNILGMTSALANGYQGYVQASIAEINAQMGENQEKYEDAMKELERMMRELGGGNDLLFDPMQLTDSAAGNGSSGSSYVPETLDEFIHRTTLTGSDIVDVTMSLISNYAELNLELPKG